MPSKKQQRNSFYFFMKERKDEFAKQGKIYSMKQMANLVSGEWAQMSLAQRQKYEEMTAAYKLHYQQFGRLASDGTSIMENYALEEEKKKREEDMRQGIKDYLGSQMLSKQEFMATNATKKFYFVFCNILVRVREDNTYIPNEIGLVEYTIKDGVRKEYHTIIDSGTIPVGYTFEAMKRSEDTHGIDVTNPQSGERDCCKIWQDIMDFIRPLSGNDLPPLYCLRQDINQTVGGLEWLAAEAGAREDMEDIKVWDASYLHWEMRAGAGCPAASYGIAEEELKSTSFDYTPGLKCEFHEEIDNMYCALRKVKALCCIISDVMCKVFNIPATERHLPERASAAKPYEVYVPTSQNAAVARERGFGRGNPRVPDPDTRPGSAVHGGACPWQSARPDPWNWRNNSTDGATNYESDNEAGTGPSGSSDEDQTQERMPSRTSGMDSVVQLRQPMSTSIALSLARARGAPAIVPGKGIGRGQRK